MLRCKTESELCKCVQNGTPAVFSSQAFTEGFMRILGAQLRWIDRNNDGNIKLNLPHIASEFGRSQIDLTECSANGSCQQQSTTTLADYVNTHLKSKSSLYCKDWHFFNDYPEMLGVLLYPLIPHCLISEQNDWLNVYWSAENNRQDYRFVYLGPDGSWTPLHADVFRSNSWSLNVCGEKEWTLFPPHATKWLQSPRTGQFIHDIRQVDKQSFPDYERLALPCAIRFTQRPAELVFIPSNWFHQVHNRGITMSINHNWCNAYNIMQMVDYFHQCRRECEDELGHLLHSPFSMPIDEWQEEVERLLTHHFGMNHSAFLDFLGSMSRRLTGNALEKCLLARQTIQNSKPT